MKDYSTKIYVNKKKLIDNIKFLEKLSEKKMLPILKANAYGHDIKLIAKILYENDYKNYVVARESEAKEIVKAINKDDIKILILDTVEDLEVIKKNPSYIVSINTFQELVRAVEFGISSLKMKIKIDFNFGINGILKDEILQLKKIIIEKNLNFNGIYAHLFSSDYEDGVKAIKEFEYIINFLGKERFPIIDIQNSMGVKFFNLKIATHIRVGDYNYGICEDENGDIEKNIKKVASIKSRISAIKNIEDSKYIAYEKKEKTLFKDKEQRIGRINLGYGDGFLKINEGTSALINGNEYEIIQINMDNSFLKIDKNVNIYDEVELYSDIYKIEKHTKLKITELLSIINERILRKEI
ncbi:MAG: alanine racemase [Fusobacteriaceae bacterium]